ncbi:MAG TPA: type IV pilus secretin PilQ [bacterium (Candidatus Stahlbacteria)]|nr:type IV pilus secretin PilQ [Candidatus Stahlbacteria bacterium]
MRKVVVVVLFFLTLVGETFCERQRPITLRFENANIRTVLDAFAELGNVNIVTSERVSGKISLNLKDVPWDRAFKTVLEVHGLTAVEREGMIGVMTMEEAEAKKKLIELETKVFRIKYAKANEMQSVIQDMLSERGRSDVDTRTNSLIITDIPTNIPKIEALIDTIDIPTPQVMIQAKIVEVDVRAARELGIKWRAGNLGFPTVATHAGGNVTVPVGAPSATFVFSTLKSLASIDATLSMLEERRKARILSEPRVAVADNEEAMILSGKKVPVITLDFAGNKIIRFYDVALKLTVTPHINPERQIMMELHPEVSDLSSEATVQGGVIILANEVRTKLMVKEGETAVIGGILRTKESTIRKGVPILSHIPLLGNLFKYTSRSRNKTELIIFITPTIVPVEKQ